MSDIEEINESSMSEVLGSDSEARIAKERKATQEKLANLEQQAKEAKFRAAKDKISRGALPIVQVLPMPEEDGAVAKIPTFFARMPIFSAAKPFHAPPEGEKLETAFGRVTRFGPGLSMTDEDIFMHTYRMCHQKLIRGPKMAHKGLSLVPLHSDGNTDLTREQMDQMLAEVDVVAGESTFYRIASTLNRIRAESEADLKHKINGTRIEDVKDSLERMARVNLKIWRPDSEIFTYMNLFYLSGHENREGKADTGSGFTIYFHPGVVEMMRVYTLQSLHIRYQLSDIGKAVYRYCSSQLWGQRTELRIRLEKLQPYTGSKSAIKFFKQGVLEGFCKPIVKTGWAESAKIDGTGRNSPLTLEIRRPSKKRS